MNDGFFGGAVATRLDEASQVAQESVERLWRFLLSSVEQIALIGFVHLGDTVRFVCIQRRHRRRQFHCRKYVVGVVADAD